MTDKLPGKKSQEENFCGDVNVQYFDWGGGLPGCMHVSSHPCVQLKCMSFIICDILQKVDIFF